MLLYRLIVRWETSTTTRADLANRLFVPGGRKQAGTGRGREREAAAAPASVPARGDPLHQSVSQSVSQSGVGCCAERTIIVYRSDPSPTEIEIPATRWRPRPPRPRPPPPPRGSFGSTASRRSLPARRGAASSPRRRRGPSQTSVITTAESVSETRVIRLGERATK